MILKNNDEVVEFLGKNTVLKFEFFSDSLCVFQTCIPKKLGDSYVFYEVTFYHNENDVFGRYDSFSEYLKKENIQKLIEFDDVTLKRTLLYQQKFSDN